MKTTARQIAIDMYKCKDNLFNNLDELHDQLNALMKEVGLEAVEFTSHQFEDNHLAICVMFPEGSLNIHAFGQLGYVSADLFLCQENASPERYFNSLKKLFKPEKTKSTQLKRGDFGTVKDMKPKTKTRIAPLRKVIRILSHKG